MIKYIRKILNRFCNRKLTATQFLFLRKEYRRRNCASCSFLGAYITWWCYNKNAWELRNTNIPGVCHCPYWKPNRKYIKQKLRKLEDYENIRITENSRTS